MNVFGERLRIQRKKHSLTQKELGKKCYLSDDIISIIERGIQKPTYEEIDIICRFFNISPDYFMGYTDFPTSLNKHKTLTVEFTHDEFRFVFNAVKQSSLPDRLKYEDIIESLTKANQELMKKK